MRAGSWQPYLHHVILPLTTADWTHVAADPSLASETFPQEFLHGWNYTCGIWKLGSRHVLDQRSRESGLHAAWEKHVCDKWWRERPSLVPKVLFSLLLGPLAFLLVGSRRHSGVFQVKSFFFFLINLFILFLAALGLRCCTWVFSSCSEWRLLFVSVHGLLTVVASLVEEHGL